MLHLFILCFSFLLLPDPQITTIEIPYPVKEEEENAMHNTVVIFSSNDSFTLKQVFIFVVQRVLLYFTFKLSSTNFSIHLDGLKLNLCLKTSPSGDH